MMMNKLKNLIVKFRCYVGIHNYQKGVSWHLAHRLDICKNPDCFNWTATYGKKRTRRWVQDEDGFAHYEIRKKIAQETRFVFSEKVETYKRDLLKHLKELEFDPEVENVD